jgi:hypothetical protein
MAPAKYEALKDSLKGQDTITATIVRIIFPFAINK